MSCKNRKMLKINFLNFAIRLILRLVFNVALHSITRILDRAKEIMHSGKKRLIGEFILAYILVLKSFLKSIICRS